MQASSLLNLLSFGRQKTWKLISSRVLFSKLVCIIRSRLWTCMMINHCDEGIMEFHGIKGEILFILIYSLRLLNILELRLYIPIELFCISIEHLAVPWNICCNLSSSNDWVLITRFIWIVLKFKWLSIDCHTLDCI